MLFAQRALPRLERALERRRRRIVVPLVFLQHAEPVHRRERRRVLLTQRARPRCEHFHEQWLSRLVLAHAPIHASQRALGSQRIWVLAAKCLLADSHRPTEQRLCFLHLASSLVYAS